MMMKAPLINDSMKNIFTKTLPLVIIAFFLVTRVMAQAPAITSFSPASGPVGTSVTITGTHFNTTVASNIVFFGATMATVTAASATSLTVTVPAGASFQPISVLNGATNLIGYSAAPFVTTFTPNKGSIATTDFTPQFTLGTGNSPGSVAIGDLDGDGKPDLVVVNRSSNTVSIFRNISTGGPVTAASFAAPVTFATGNNPLDVAISDLDGDGKPDLVVANANSNNLSVLRNTTTSGAIDASSFAAQVTFATGSFPNSIAIGDLDGDGKPDLVTTNNSDNTLSILRNTATSGAITASSFAAQVTFATGTNPESVAIGDLDDDGKPDLVVANLNSNTVSVLRNTATSGTINSSSFAAQVAFATGTNPARVAIGDLDGDGKSDLVVANANSNTVSVLRNMATSGFIDASSFASQVTFAVGTGPRSVAIGDLDGDGKPDLMVANNIGNTVSVLRNTATSGTITTSSFAAQAIFTTGSVPQGVAIGDLDGDGKPDMVTANINASTVSVLRNNPQLQPIITSFSPASGPVGTSVTITGTNFNTTAASNIVFFGATMATVTVASATSLTVTVPAGASYQPISVLNGATNLIGYSAAPFVTTFTPNKGSITTADISAKVDFATGSNPFSAAIGDLDGDGKPDLAVVNEHGNTVSVYFNTSAGGSITAASFAAKVDFATGSTPISVAIGDLDGDGKPDLVVTNSMDNTVSVLRNTSVSGSITSGSFAAKVDFATGALPLNVAIGDLDGDGKPDLAVANESGNTVSVLHNTSTSGSITAASFAASVDFSTGSGSLPFSVAIGDLDGDGKPDLAVANRSFASVSVFRNTSTSGSITSGSFAAKVDFVTGFLPFSVAIGDLDGDGKPDLAVANRTGNTISVLRNTSASGSITSGSFAAKVDFATGISPQSVAIGDLDGDGKPDLVSANFSSNTVSVLRNTSASGSITSGSFAAKVDFATGTNPQSVAIGDLDGDGRPDLAVTNFNSNTVSILRNNPVLPPTITSFTPASGPVGTSVTITGTNFNTTTTNNIVFFGATMATVTAASTTSLTVTAPAGTTYRPISVLNGPVALTGYSAVPFATTFTPNTGSITTADISAKVDFATGNNPFGVAIGDLDGDGKPDLAVVNEGGTISVYRNISTSGAIASGSFAAKVDFATGTLPISVAIGDLDGDGKPDLAVTNRSDNTVSVLRNTAVSGSITSGSFAAKVDFATGNNPFSVTIGDLDGDGKPDLAVVNHNDNTVSVLRNTSASGSITSGSFAAKVDFATGTSPVSIAVGDLDRDGKPDLAVANFGGNTVSVLRNTSASGSITAASFAAKVDFATGGLPRDLAIGDLDGDGKPDLVVANNNDNTVSVLRNTSASGSITSGSFAAKVDFATGSNPTSVAIGDLDGDGRPDLAVVNSNDITVSVLRNSSASGSITAASFAAKIDFATGGNSANVAIGDLDGDGRPDLVVTNVNSNTISILRDDPVFPPPTITSFTPASGPVGTSVTVTGTNFNTTAANNIVFFGATMATVTAASTTSLTVTVPAGATYQPVSVLNGATNLIGYSAAPFVTTFTPNKGSIAATDFTPQFTLGTGTAPSSEAIGDLDGDGKPDLVVANHNSNTVSVFRNISTGGPLTMASFAAPVTFVSSNPASVIIGDLDGDGKPDLVVVNQSGNTVSVLRNTATSGTISSSSFAAPVTFAAGSLPSSIAIGDLDGDGKPDLAVVNTGSNNVSILRNTAISGAITTSSFAAQVTFATGSTPNSIAISDLDGDSKPDLVVTNQSGNTVSVLRNTATTGAITASSFAAQVTFATGHHPNGVAIGDLDGDGKPDVAVANENDHTVSVFRNTATSGAITASSFAAQVAFTTGIDPVSVVIGDLDGDGKPDLVVANIADNDVSVLRNTATSGTITTASFAAQVTLATGANPFAVAIADLDGDGKADLVAVNEGVGTLSVLRNNPFLAPTTQAGNIIFTSTTTTATTASWTNGNGAARAVFMLAGATGSPAPVDFTGYTANAAFASGDQIGSTGWYCVYNGTGITVNITGLTAGTTYRVMTVEYNGTGSSATYLTTTATGNPANVTTNFPPPTITSFTPASGPVGTSVTITGTNFNITAANNIVFFGATMATVTAASTTSLTVTVPAGATYQPISVLNGATNLIGYSAAPFVTTFTPNKGSIAATDFIPQFTLGIGTITSAIALNDLDGDGKPDLVVASVAGNNVSIFRNISTGGSLTAASFAAPVSFAAGSGPTSIAIGDLDGDGKPDIVVADANGNTVAILRNTATSGAITASSFAAPVTFATGSQPRSVAMGDLDGDGKPDLVLANNGNQTLSVLRNTATSGVINSSSFAAQVAFGTGANPFSVAIGDLDGDGKPDLAVANASGNTVSVLRNTATSGVITASSFAAKVDFATGFAPESIAIGDLDGDGKPDLAVINNGSNSISVLRNTSSVGAITSGSFAAKVDFATGSTPKSIAIGDLDGDGKPDLVTANSNSNSVSVLRNGAITGVINSSSFAAQVTLTVGTVPISVAIGDLDGDGKADLMVANQNDKTVSILRNDPLIAPTTQASNIIFTNTTTTATTANWTNGNGGARAMFMLAGTTGGPAPVDLTAYNANAAFASGDQIGSTGWYCVYNGTGTTVNITGLAAGSTYRVMTVEYNGTVSNVAYLTTTATGNPANISTIGPVISATGSLSAVNTTYGTASPTPTTFTVGGTNLAANLVVAPPSGFEVSSTSSTSGYASTVTLAPSAGTVAATTIYLRLSATTDVGTYGNSGNVVLTSTGATTVNVATVSSTVSPAAITIIASDVTKPYGTVITGGPGATAFSITSGALQNGNTISSVTIVYGTGASATDAAATYTGSVTPSAAAGANGFLTSNYNITYATGNIIVTRPPLTITATGPTKTYGTALTTGTSTTNFTVTGTPASGEAITSVTLTPDAAGLSATTPAGASYTVTPGAATGTGGFFASNYNITYVPFNGTVGRGTLTVTATGLAKTYGTALTTTASVTNFTVTGTPASGEAITSVTLTPDAAGQAAATPAGSSYSVTPSAATGTGGFLATNYNIAYVPFSGTVAKANFTITANDVNKVPGTTLTGGVGSTAFTTTRLQNGETVGTITIAYGIGSAAGDASGTYTAQVAPSAATGGTFTAGNYIITYANGNIIVGTSAINITGTLTTLNTTYGTASANASFNVSGSNLSNDITVTAPTGFEVSATPVNGFGRSITLTQSGGSVSSTTVFIRLSAAAAANSYSGNVVLTSNGAATVNVAAVSSTVSPALLTIAATNVTKVYGAVNPALALTYSGFVNGDTNTNLTTQPGIATTAVTGSQVGTYPITPSGAVSHNYTISYTAGTLTVTPATLTIAASDATKIYGAVNPALAVTYSGFVNGDSNNSLATQPTITTTAVTGSPVGTYPIKPSGATDNNYAISYVNGTLTVGRATLTITVDNQSKTYGQANPTLTVSYSGFMNGDNNTSLTTQPTVTTTAVTGSPAGTYPVTASAAVSPNYTISYTAGTLTVIRATLTITASDATKVYGVVNPALAVTYSGFVNGDTQASLTSPATAATIASTNSPNGTYPITASGAAGNNYTITYINGTLTILSATRTLTFNSLPTKTYGNADFNPGATASSGETAIYVSNNTSVATIVNGNIHITGAGTTTITASLPANSNYTGSPTASQVLVVDKATQTITFVAIPTQMRGSSYALSSVTATSGLPVSFSSADLFIATVQGQTLSLLRLGITTITASQGGDANYLPATSVVQTVTVTDAAADEVLVHQAVSPNGDGINDFLYIEGIEQYLNNRLTIINRNGVKIFEINGYDNTSHVFDGHSNITGSLQQQGTYFYLLQYTVNGEGTRKTGFFVLKY
jgi:gliding motility-associated-like protein